MIGRSAFRRRTASWLTLASAALLGCIFVSAASAKAFVIPHVLEKSGSISNTQDTFDTQFFMTYGGSGSGAQVDLYLYDDSGQMMRSGSGQNVCGPCTYALGNGGPGAVGRKRTVVLDTEIMAHGGFPPAGIVLGYGVLVVGGSDPDNVALQGFVVNAHTGPFDLSTTEMPPQAMGPDPCDPIPSAVKGFVLPHVLEKSGTISTTQYTFDTSIFATYTPGQGGTPPGPGATDQLYLYDNTGAPMTSVTTEVCKPCTRDLTPSRR
jgi:hypothetical protein